MAVLPGRERTEWWKVSVSTNQRLEEEDSLVMSTQHESKRGRYGREGDANSSEMLTAGICRELRYGRDGDRNRDGPVTSILRSYSSAHPI